MRLYLAADDRGLSPDGIECGTVSHLEILLGIATITLERSIKDGSESDSLGSLIVSSLGVNIDDGVNFIVNRHASLVSKAVKAHEPIV